MVKIIDGNKDTIFFFAKSDTYRMKCIYRLIKNAIFVAFKK